MTHRSGDGKEVKGAHWTLLKRRANLNTMGSSFDTVLAAFTRTDEGSWQEFGCSDDADGLARHRPLA